MYGYIDLIITWLDGHIENVLARSVHIKDNVLQIEDCNIRGKYRYIPLIQLREWEEKHG